MEMTGEFLNILKRAFADGVDIVHVDGWNNRDTSYAMMSAMELGYVTRSMNKDYPAIDYTITSLGKLKLR